MPSKLNLVCLSALGALWLNGEVNVNIEVSFSASALAIALCLFLKQ